MSEQLAISEVFPTLQGEGPYAGHSAVFVRLAGCNLACRWCDTPYTWDWKGQNGQRFSPKAEITLLDPRAVAAEVERLSAGWVNPLVVITGGEPLLQQSALAQMMDALWHGDRAFHFQFETNGTVLPDAALEWFCPTWVVSPKLENAGMDQERTVQDEALKRFATQWDRVHWKFVVQHAADLDEIQALVERFGIVGPVYVMPEGKLYHDMVRRARELAPLIVQRGWRLAFREHLALYDGKRGH